MNKTNHSRKIGSVTFASGARQTIEIDRDGVLLELTARLKFRITNTATAPVTPLYQALAALIKRLEIIVGGRDTVWSITGSALATRVAYEDGIAALGADATVVVTASAATDYDVTLPLQFFLPNGRRPDDTGLDLRRVSTCTLAVTWGTTDAADVFKTPNGATISLVTLDVEGHYLLGAAAEDVYLVRTLDQVEQTITGSTSNLQIVMDRGSGLFYRSFQIETLVDGQGNNGVLDPGQGVEIVAGSFVFKNRNAVQVRAHNKREYRLSPIAGVYMLPLSLFGQGVTWINTSQLTSDLKLQLDATFVAGGTNLIRVTREGVRPLKLA